MIASLASKVLPMVLKGLIGQVPALKKLDKVVSYMEDDNELDDAIKAHRDELDVFKGQIIILNKESEQFKKEIELLKEKVRNNGNK